jgi:hypothetical protein
MPHFLASNSCLAVASPSALVNMLRIPMIVVVGSARGRPGGADGYDPWRNQEEERNGTLKKERGGRVFITRSNRIYRHARLLEMPRRTCWRGTRLMKRTQGAGPSLDQRWVRVAVRLPGIHRSRPAKRNHLWQAGPGPKDALGSGTVGLGGSTQSVPSSPIRLVTMSRRWCVPMS